VNEPNIQLRLGVAPGDGAAPQPVAMTLTGDKFRVLLHELKQAYSAMENVEGV